MTVYEAPACKGLITGLLLAHAWNIVGANTTGKTVHKCLLLDAHYS